MQPERSPAGNSIFRLTSARSSSSIDGWAEVDTFRRTHCNGHNGAMLTDRSPLVIRPGQWLRAPRFFSEQRPFSGARSVAQKRIGTSLERHAPINATDDLTYAVSVDSFFKRLVIRAIEWVSGRPELLVKSAAFLRQHRQAEDFWAHLPAAIGVTLELDGEPLSAALPRTGPLIVVANHPFGVIDGMLLASLVADFRSDFLIMVNARLNPPAPIIHQWLAIDVEDVNIAPHRRLGPVLRAVRHLRRGGCIILFPAGAVATTPRLFASYAVEAPWAGGLALLLNRTQPQILPVFFHGQNSPLFQAASHFSMTLRLGLLLHETVRRFGKPQHITVGRPIALPPGLGGPDPIGSIRATTLALGERVQ